MTARNEKLILVLVLVGSLIVALAAGTGVYLLKSRSNELADENAGLEARVTKARTKLNQLNALRAEREKAQARLEVAERILPSQEEIENLVDSLADFARESGVVITEAAPVRQSGYRNVGGAGKRFEEADFDLDVEGDFFQFVRFVNLLENYKRFIRVDSFTVDAGKNHEEPHSINLKFATFTYTDAPSSLSPGARARPGKGG